MFYRPFTYETRSTGTLGQHRKKSPNLVPALSYPSLPAGSPITWAVIDRSLCVAVGNSIPDPGAALGLTVPPMPPPHPHRHQSMICLHLSPSPCVSCDTYPVTVQSSIPVSFNGDCFNCFPWWNYHSWRAWRNCHDKCYPGEWDFQ